MNKSLFLTLTWFLSLLSLIGQDQLFTIEAFTHDVPDGTIVYLDDPELNFHLDSTTVLSDHFLFTGEVSGPTQYVLFMAYEETYDYRYVYIEDGQTKIDAREATLRDAVVTGGECQRQSDELQGLLKKSDEEIALSNEQLFGTTDLSTETKDSLMQQRADAYRDQQRIAKRFIKRYPDSPVSSLHLTFLKNRLGKKEAAAFYHLLTTKQKESANGRYIWDWIQNAVTLEVGDRAPDFMLPDLSATEVSLSQFKGHFVLLEFGATGCYPCRLENPNLYKAYKNYKEEGFEILSVWLDRQVASWRRTVGQDNMIWTTVSDLKGNHGQVPTLYNVTYMPTNYLLDPEGVVIAKDVRGTALENKLADIFADGGNK